MHDINKAIDKAYQSGYNDGFNDGKSAGRYGVLYTLLEIRNNAKYPEYLEEDIDEYLKMEDLL